MSSQRRILKGGTRLTQLEAAARARLEESQILAEQKKFHSAIYLAGYALECLLKVAIGNRNPGFRLEGQHEHHRLEDLRAASGLIFDSTESRLKNCFSEIMLEWSSELRYFSNRYPNSERAKNLLKSMEEIYHWLWQKTH